MANLEIDLRKNKWRFKLEKCLVQEEGLVS